MDANFQSDQNVRVLQIYNVYRLTLTFILLFSFLADTSGTQFGNHAPGLYLYTLLFMLGFSLLVIFGIKPEQSIESRPRLLTALLICDIFCIALLSFSSRGILSGLALLQLVTIAAGSILIPGRIGTFLAAIATLATLYGEIYLSFSRNISPNQYIQCGLLGALLFAASLYLQVLSERMRHSAKLAAEQASSIVNLEQLNQLIIARMRTGILVLSPHGELITCNEAAARLLDLHGKPAAGKIGIPPVLLKNLKQWQENKHKRPPAFRLQDSRPLLQANFTNLNPQSSADILVFLEDTSQIIQRVRQMKLASLGRLTASIAHEIRNPLGAISHATQLLAENEKINPGDQRLLEIILNHSARVNLIIEDVLHMSRHKQESAERINLHDWLTRYVHNYCEAHQLPDCIRIEIEPRRTEVRIITSQFEQILNNLVENGLRYSLQGSGQQSLTLRGGIPADSRSQTPELHVIDEGPGVNPEQEERLFEPFYTTEPSGTGLGLYISKELCEANQAQLTYRRTKQGKSCFSIHFAHPDRNID